MTKRLEIGLLVLIIAVGAYLRFSHWGALQLQSDEAMAAHLAMQFVRQGIFPTAGLMSSVGVTNPPLFIYVLIPLFAISSQPALVEMMIAALALGSVVVCWHIGRRYYGTIAGLTGAALFAVSPWAVIYSRQIWAQDIVPIITTLLLWAVHAVVMGGRPRAVFWVILLASCVAQIHFAGLAMLAAVLTILVVLRPRINWRWAAAGVVVATLLFLPYLVLQQKNNWLDFRRAAQTVGGTDQRIPPGMTVDPYFGHRLPSRDHWRHALAIMNAGQIEDVLGLTADPRADSQQTYARLRGGRGDYFSDTLTLGDWLLTGQRWLFVVALLFLAGTALRALRLQKAFPWVFVTTQPEKQSAWILILWFAAPLVVFGVTGLRTYLTYFVILYPMHFLILGAGFQTAVSRFKPLAARVACYGVLVAVLVGNGVLMLDFYRFIERHGGALGTYGTVLSFKEQTAKFLAERLDREQSQLVYDLTTDPQGTAKVRGRTVPELAKEVRLVQLARPGVVELPQLDLPFLILLQPPPGPAERIPADWTVMVVDGNKSHMEPRDWTQLSSLQHTNFGPMYLYYIKPDRPTERR